MKLGTNTSSPNPRDSESDQGYEELSPWVELTNEFTTVVVRKVQTRDGVRLEIKSPKLQSVTFLDPLQLESLTWASKEFFSRLFETPFGSE